MKTRLLILVVLMVVVLSLSTGVQAVSVTSVSQANALIVPDQGMGLSLTLPSGSIVQMPTILEPISVIQITLGTASAFGQGAKVEIYAERLSEGLVYESWQTLQQVAPNPYNIREIHQESIQVDGKSGIFRTLESPVGNLWEVEIFANQVVYRISTLYQPQAEAFYHAVLAGIEFTGSSLLPPNEQVAAVQSGGGVPQAKPTLNFPFNGTKTITCAYYADDHSCHATSLYALDFNLNYEAVRAAHSGSLGRYSDSCSGKYAQIVYNSDTSYNTLYVHLDAYMGSTGSVSQGDYIARSGSTGSCASGPHLHFALRQNTTAIKPEPMCGQTGFLKGQVKTDCWPSSEKFNSGAYTQISITQASVNLNVCASNLPGRTVYVSMWRPASGGYAERSWLVSKNATSSCVLFSDIDGSGDTLTGVYYYTNAALRSIPSDLARQQKTSCYSASGSKLMCDRVRR